MSDGGRDTPVRDTPALDPERIALLRRDLIAAGFTVDGLRDRWGAVADAALGRGDRVPALRALVAGAASDPLAVLGRLFVLGGDVAPDPVAAALPGLGLEGATRLGLIAPEHDDSVRALIDLRPYTVVDSAGVASWWIASDLGESVLGGALRTDHVLGVGGASATLSGILLPDEVGTAVDLGTGSGIQALHASRFARRVIATDISHRALAFARFTAELCGVRTIEFRYGDLWRPLGGERVDRILSNPPFVITPRAPGVPRYDYRDAGLVGDELLREVVTGSARHLAAGGVAQLLGNWEYPAAGGGGPERVGDWARAAGLEWWVVERDVVDPARYAETWIRDGGSRPGSEGYETLLRAWLEDFEVREIERIGFGLVLLRKPAASASAPPLQRIERLGGAMELSAGLGAHLAAALRARDRIAGVDDAALGALTFRVAPDVTEERSHWPGEEHPRVIRLRQGGGFGRDVPVGTALAAAVGACDGELPWNAIVRAVAELLDADPGALAAELMPQLRELVVSGLLLGTAAGPAAGRG